MNSTSDSIDAINKYFETSYKKKTEVINSSNSIFELEELMRLVWRIQENGFFVNIQDLNHLTKKTNYRIWFNRKSDMLECFFGQISQSSADGYLEEEDLVHCLIYSIGEWCKYNRTLNSTLEWDNNLGYFVNFYTNEKILLYRIYKENDTIGKQNLYLEYIDFNLKKVKIDFIKCSLLSVKGTALYMMYDRVKDLTDDPQKYNLEKY